MIITNTVVVYDPIRKEVVGEFHAGADLYIGSGMASYNGSLKAFMSEHPDYQVGIF